MTHTDNPLILTVHLDQESFEKLDALRRAYFPPQRNLVPAHITLFHALPGIELSAIQDDLAAVCAVTSPFPIAFSGVRFLGAGVAVEADAPALAALRRRLATRWQPWLGAQDRQRPRFHVTIQNKVAPHTARALHAELAATWQPWNGTGNGLILWRYLGGPWRREGVYAFNSG